MSISGGTPVDKEQSHKDSPQAMSSPIPQAVLQPPVSASQTHQPPSNVNIGRITFHRNAPPETPLPPLDASCHRRRPSESGIQLSQHPPQNTQPKTRQRSASVSIDTMSGPGGRSQPASLLSNGQAPIGTGRRLSRFGRRSSDGIVHPPPLETIIGSPPDSPPAATGLLETTSGQVPRLNLPVAMTKGGISLDGIVGRAFAGLKADAKFSSTPTPTPSATTTALSAISTLSSTWNSTSTSTQIRNYARIDDEEAQAEAQRLEPHRASASLRSSIHAPTSTFPRAQAQGVQRKTMSSTTAGCASLLFL